MGSAPPKRSYVMHTSGRHWGGSLPELVRWTVTAFTAVIGLTVYAASEDLTLSFLLAVALGCSALAGSAMLMVGLRAGYPVAAAASLGLVLFESINIGAFGLRWLHVFYLTIGIVVLLGCAGAAVLAVARRVRAAETSNAPRVTAHR